MKWSTTEPVKYEVMSSKERVKLEPDMMHLGRYVPECISLWFLSCYADTERDTVEPAAPTAPVEIANALIATSSIVAKQLGRC
jgi:hypothetical protein